MYLILMLDYVGNLGSHDVKLQVTMEAKFNVSEVLSMSCNSDLGVSEDESSCGEGEVAMLTEGQVL